MLDLLLPSAVLDLLPSALDKAASLVLLENLPNADLCLVVSAILLLFLAFLQLHAFSRPPPVPLKRLPKRPTLQVLFKPEDVSAATAWSLAQQNIAAAAVSAAAAAAAAEAAGGKNNELRRSPPRRPRRGININTRIVGGGQQQQNYHDVDEEDEDGPIELDGDFVTSHRPGRRVTAAGAGDFGSGGAAGVGGTAKNARRGVDEDDNRTASTRGESTSGNTTANASSLPKHMNMDLPDSFAPLLSSSLMEVISTQLTPDLLHAIHFEGGVKLKEGRHEIPLDKDSSRPQFALDVGEEGCKMTAAASIGSDQLSTAQDLDIGRPTTMRSQPMVKYASVTLDPPLPLANVAPTLIHFPTLFEDNIVSSLHRIRFYTFALEMIAAFSSLIEKILWMVESRCKIHLSKIRVTPLYKGATENNAPQWRLSLSFSGHLLIFGWLPIPFISVTLPTFIIPQPHALLEHLLTAQPLASAKVKRENIAEQRVVLAALASAESWNCKLKAVATPPAVGIDLTVPGGLTVALEMMHGRDLFAGVRRHEGGGDTPPRSPSLGSLSSWGASDIHNNKRHPSFVVPQPLGRTSIAIPTREPFDANSLVPWFFDVAITGRVDKDKIRIMVSKLSASHESRPLKDMSSTSSKFSVTGSFVISKADPSSAVTAIGPSHLASLAKHGRKMPSTSHLNALAASAGVPTIFEVLLYPNTSPSVPVGQRLNQLLAYDYAFSISDDTQLDAISLSIGATHPMLKGGTLITTVIESIYAYGSLSAREGAIFDMTEKRRKRNILRHLPAVDFTAGIQNIFIPEQSMSYSDDGQTNCLPQLKGGRMMIRIVGGIMDDDDDDAEEPDDDCVAEGIKFILDFGASSFEVNNETNINEFPELEVMEKSLLRTLLSGTFGGRVAAHLRPQSLGRSISGTAPNVFNPLEAYEIEFTKSKFSLKLKEGSMWLGHRRVILPSETSFAVTILKSLVDMSFEGTTECELLWDFQGSSPILQVTDIGTSPFSASHEQRDQVELIISELRQGRFNLQVSPVGGLSIKKAVTNREDKQGLYDWKFFNAIVAPNDDSASLLLQVVHDKRTMKKLLQIVKLLNSDLEKILYYVLTRVWRAKDIFDKEGISDPGKLIPGHRMARLASLFLCGDVTQIDEILPIIQRVVAGEGLDVVKVKDLLRKNVDAYDDWAPEIDRMVRWVDVAVSPMDANKPYIENEVPPLSELPVHSYLFESIPSAKVIYETLLDKQEIPLDPSFSNLVAQTAPYMNKSQVEFVLQSRKRPSDWQPQDLRRLRYVLAVKKKVQEISESYGGLSFLPQSFFVSIFLGEATRASLRASRRSEHLADARREVELPSEVSSGRRGSTMTRLRRKRMYAPQSSFMPDSSQYGSSDHLEDFLSPAGRVASMGNMNAYKRFTTQQRGQSDVAESEGGSGYELGDSLLGPSDVAILLQAGLASSMKGSTVVQLNQRMLLDLMASQPKTFAIAVLAEIGTPGGQGSPRGLASALMALLELDQSSFTRFHRLDMHSLLETWLGMKIPKREDYLAGGRWARQSYYESLFGVAKSILEDAETYMALKGHVQRVRHNCETDPLPLAKEIEYEKENVGIPIDASFSARGDSENANKIIQAIDAAKDQIARADLEGHRALEEIKVFPNSTVDELKVCCSATELYKVAFVKCAEVLKLDKLAFQSEWLKDFYRRNYDALMIKNVYDNIIDDTDSVRAWMDALRKGDAMRKSLAGGGQADLDNSQHIGLTPPSSPRHHPGHHTPLTRLPFTPGRRDEEEAKRKDDSTGAFFAMPEDRTQQELVDGIIDALFFYEEERAGLRNDPLVRLLIENPPGKLNFTIVTAMGVITEGKKGLELAAALRRLKEKRGVNTVRSDTGTARSLEYNAGKIEEAIETAVAMGKPYGLLGYSQGCANALTAESLLLSGSPDQQKMLSAAGGGLVCRQILFSAANGSMHGPSSDVKVSRLITMAESFFKYQQGYCSRELISTVLELLNSFMDSAGFQKFTGGTQSFLPDGCRAFWREAQHLPHVPTTVLRGVLEPHTTPESLDMISNLLTKQSGSALHDSQVHVYDAVAHPVYSINRNGKILKNSDMGGAVQRTHHWSPLNEEVDFVKTKRDIEQASFDCAKDRHVFPWVEVNARFGLISYMQEDEVGEDRVLKKDDSWLPIVPVGKSDDGDDSKECHQCQE